MITKAQVKHIQSLDDKKYRNEYRQFVVEGEKIVEELLNTNWPIEAIYASRNWIQEHKEINQAIVLIEVEQFELEKISSLSTPNQVIAISKIPSARSVISNLAILLDGLQDPGNLGSIIRIADWYNIPTIYCSETCVDAFNNKVIQASMGSIFRVHIEKRNLEALLLENLTISTYATVLNGKDIHTFDKIAEGFIIIGNEARGVSETLISLSKYHVSIPKKGNAESLNAAVATGIVCDCLL